MSDLVSRSELLKFLDEEVKQIHIDEEINHIDTNAVKGMYAVLKAITNFIKEQQTAYDVEKVVEQRNKAIDEFLERCKSGVQNGELYDFIKWNNWNDCACAWFEEIAEQLKGGGLNE